MGTQPIDMSIYQPSVLAQRMIDMLKTQAGTENKTASINYLNALDQVNQANLWNSGMGRPLLPPPTPPKMLIVNEDVVRMIEQAKPEDKIDLNTPVYLEYYYQPVTPPAPAHAKLVIGAEDAYYPGLYDTVGEGDGEWIPIGFVVAQDGHEYTKTPLYPSPFAPLKFVTKFKRTK